MRCLLYPRWCPKRRVSTWSCLKRSEVGLGNARGELEDHAINAMIAWWLVFFSSVASVFMCNSWLMCLCVCVTSQLLKLRSSSMTLDINQKLVSHCNLRSGDHPYQNLRPTHTHTQTNTIYIAHTIAHRISIWDAYSCPKKEMPELAAENAYLQSLPIFASQWITCWRCKEVYIAHSKFMAVFHQASQIQPAISESCVLAGARYEPSTFCLC